MLTAINKNTGIKYIAWKSFLEIREIYVKDKNSFICPYCNEQLIFVDGNMVIKHFRHKIESVCEYEPETEIHLEMKKYIQKKFNLSDDEIEYTKLLHYGFKPDGFIEKENIAIEVQHSILTEESFIERTQKYSNNNISVLWIFDKDIINKNVPSMIKKAHEIYYGRIYAYDKITKSIYPIHLIPIQRWIKPFNDQGGSYKYYKKKKYLKIGKKIENFKLKKSYNNWKNNNYYIANFYDKKFWDKDEEVKINIEYENNCNDNLCPGCGNWKDEQYEFCYNCFAEENGWDND